MRRRNDPLTVEDELEELRTRNAQLDDQLQESKDENEHIANELIAVNMGVNRNASLSLGVFPLICGVIVICRWVIWLYVEKSGTTAFWVGAGVSISLGAIVVAVLGQWVVDGWKLLGWLMLPKLVVVLVALLVAATVFSSKIWDGVVTTPDGHPARAVMLVIASFLLVASSGLERGIKGVAALLDRLIDLIGKVL